MPIAANAKNEKFGTRVALPKKAIKEKSVKAEVGLVIADRGDCRKESPLLDVLSSHSSY